MVKGVSKGRGGVQGGTESGGRMPRPRHPDCPGTAPVSFLRCDGSMTPHARMWSWSASQELGDTERQVQGLAAVEPGIAGGGVALVKLVLHDILHAAEALGDVVPGQFDVDATRPGADLTMGREESLELSDDVVEPPRLLAALGGEGVSVH